MKNILKVIVRRLLLRYGCQAVRILIEHPELWTGNVPRTLVWQLADSYDIRVNTHWRPVGRNPVIIDGGEYQKQHQIPKSVYFNTASGVIHIGVNTLFGEDVMLLTGKHYSIQEALANDAPLHHVPADGRDITIGKACFIGSGAIILGGVKIGDYAVIGAGSVVTQDVPEYAFVAGVPARVIRMLKQTNERE